MALLLMLFVMKTTSCGATLCRCENSLIRLLRRYYLRLDNRESEYEGNTEREGKRKGGHDKESEDEGITDREGDLEGV